MIEAKLNAPINSLAESEYVLHSGQHRSGALEFRPTVGAHSATGTADLGFLPELAEAAALIERGFTVPRDLQAIHPSRRGSEAAKRIFENKGMHATPQGPSRPLKNEDQSVLGSDIYLALLVTT